MIRLIKNIKKKKISKIKKYSQFYETPFGKKILEKELMILKKELNGCNIILSVGCGTAIHEIQLAKSNPDLEIICLDPSKEMLGESQNLSKEIKLFQGKAEQLPLRNETFDCVYFITSFEFIENSFSALNETSRVLKPMGNALFFINVYWNFNDTSRFYL